MNPDVLLLEERRGKYNERRRKRFLNPEYRREYNERQKRYLSNSENRERRNKQHRESLNLLRKKTIAFLGSKCVRCTKDEWGILQEECIKEEVDVQRILQFDHKNGGGHKEKGDIGHQKRFYKEIMKYPEKYQLLCPNHNWIKRYENGEGYNNSSEISRTTKRKRNRRKETILFLGGRCVECRENNWMILDIDHKNGGGRKEKRELGNYQFLKGVKRHPEKYQILCVNCNWIKAHKNGEFKNCGRSSKFNIKEVNN
jgi:hypothetical protein